MLLVAGHRRELERHMRLVAVVVRRSLAEAEVGLHSHHEEEQESRNLGEEHHSLGVEERRSLVEVEEVGHNLGVDRMADMGCEMVEERHTARVAGNHGAVVAGHSGREEVL